MSSPYQPGIPTGTVNLNVDYQNIQSNFQQLNTIFGVDHVPFDNVAPPPNGYHQSIHLNPVSTTATNPPNNQPVLPPATTAGFGQLFSSQINQGPNTDQVLYFLSGGGRLTQLTGTAAPLAAQNGYTFLPGGLLLQWGISNSTVGGTITFSTANIAFPNNCFTVFAQPRSSSAPGGSATIAIRSKTNTSFNYDYVTSSGSYNGFFWAAIGN